MKGIIVGHPFPILITQIFFSTAKKKKDVSHNVVLLNLYIISFWLLQCKLTWRFSVSSMRQSLKDLQTQIEDLRSESPPNSSECLKWFPFKIHLRTVDTGYQDQLDFLRALVRRVCREALQAMWKHRSFYCNLTASAKQVASFFL